MIPTYHPLHRALALCVMMAALTGCAELSQLQQSLPIGQRKEAANREFSYVSQEGISRHACGPVSLVNALGAGTPRWQEALAPYNARGNRDAVSKIIRQHGTRPSRTIPTRQRWNTRMGMNIVDLTQTAQEMAGDLDLPPIRSQVTISARPQLSPADLPTIHRKLGLSFTQGLPPIINISRIAYQSPSRDQFKIWDTIGSHSVVITKLGRITKEQGGQQSFQIEYVDPATGQELSGMVSTPPATSKLPQNALHVHVPESDIFRTGIPRTTTSYLSLSSIIGAF